MAEDRVVLRVQGLTKSFPLRRGALGRTLERVRAVDGVDLEVRAGTTTGIVGESGSGKTTVGQLMARLLTPDRGSVEVEGRDVTRARGRELKQMRGRLQIIFQDPYGALDPTKTIGHAVAEPLLVHGRIGRGELRDQAASLLSRVALDPGLVDRYPDELSGGQRQRVCIARALALSPSVLVADEPTSALDLSTRSEILNLLLSIQQDTGQAIVLVSHDFATVRHLSHRIAVMYLGRIVEEGPAERVAERPLHPYTRALLSAVPLPDPRAQRARSRIVLLGDLPDPANPPAGCRFHTRCPEARAECALQDPPLLQIEEGHRVACLLHQPPDGSSPGAAAEPTTTASTPPPSPMPTASLGSPASSPGPAPAVPPSPTSSSSTSPVSTAAGSPAGSPGSAHVAPHFSTSSSSASPVSTAPGSPAGSPGSAPAAPHSSTPSPSASPVSTTVGSPPGSPGPAHAAPPAGHPPGARQPRR